MLASSLTPILLYKLMIPRALLRSPKYQSHGHLEPNHFIRPSLSVYLWSVVEFSLVVFWKLDECGLVDRNNLNQLDTLHMYVSGF